MKTATQLAIALCTALNLALAQGTPKPETVNVKVTQADNEVMSYQLNRAYIRVRTSIGHHVSEVDIGQFIQQHPQATGLKLKLFGMTYFMDFSKRDEGFKPATKPEHHNFTDAYAQTKKSSDHELKLIKIIKRAHRASQLSSPINPVDIREWRKELSARRNAKIVSRDNNLRLWMSYVRHRLAERATETPAAPRKSVFRKAADLTVQGLAKDLLTIGSFSSRRKIVRQFRAPSARRERQGYKQQLKIEDY